MFDLTWVGEVLIDNYQKVITLRSKVSYRNDATFYRASLGYDEYYQLERRCHELSCDGQCELLIKYAPTP